MDEFLKLRKRLHDALREAAKEDPGKPYEGEMAIEIHYPGIYEYSDEVDAVVIRADFYLIGPTRHYAWKGRSVEEAVGRAAYDIDFWIKKLEKDNEDYEDYDQNGT